MAKVLVVATSYSGTLDNSDITTGSWVEEIASPYFLWREAGIGVDLASINGGEIPFDEASKSGDFCTPEAAAFLEDAKAVEAYKNSKAIADITDLSEYAAIFLPGGHGVCFDAPKSEKLAELLAKFWAEGKVVSAVCHGPAGLVSAKKADGTPLVSGLTVTGFTNSEEIAVGKDKNVPFLLEDRLKELGGTYVRGDDWSPFAVRDGNMITGQNPQSSARVADLVKEAIFPAAPLQHGKGDGAGLHHREHDKAREDHHDHNEAHAKV